MSRCTLADIAGMEKSYITPQEAGDVLQADPQAIRVAARQRPELLGFPVIVYGSRVKIPRKAFLQFMGETENDEEKRSH